MSFPPPPQNPSPPYGSGPYGPGQGSAADRPRRRRGRKPLILALIFGVVGVALIVVGAVVGYSKSLSKVDHFPRVTVADRTGTIELSAGNHVAYYEADGADNKTDAIPVPEIMLKGPDGHVQTLDTLYGGGNVDTSREIKSHLSYSNNGHDGVAIYQFKVSSTGRYDVEIMPKYGQAAQDSDIAFGTSIATGLAIGGVLVVLGLLLVVAAIVLLIVGLVKRSRHNKELLAGGAYGSPYSVGGAPGYGSYPPPSSPQPGSGYPPPGQGGYPPPGQGGGYPPPGQGGYPPPPGQQGSSGQSGQGGSSGPWQSPG